MGDIPLLYGDFISPNADPRIYEITDIAKVNMRDTCVLFMYMYMYNYYEGCGNIELTAGHTGNCTCIHVHVCTCIQLKFNLADIQ